MKRSLLAVAFLLLTCVSGFSQTPSSIPYQAVARNASGNLLSNQSVGLRFTVHQSTATGGTQYQETQTATTNKLGLFNVNMGAGTVVSGTFAGITWSDGQPKFLQVEIDPAGGTIYTDMGATQMMSVPYALFAGRASTVTSSNLTESTSNVLSITGGSNSVVSASGTTIQVKKATASQDGYLAAADWTTFNNKQNAITLSTSGTSGAATFVANTLNIPNYTLAGLGGIGLSALSASSPLSYNNGTGAFSISQATTSVNGYLSSTDWNTFNGKQAALTFTAPLANSSNTVTIGYDNSTIKMNASNQLYAVNTGTVTGVTASNGLTSSGGNTPNITLGGTLAVGTTITQGNFNMVHSLTGTGDFEVLENGTTPSIYVLGKHSATTDGYVGIGTATPSGPLDVSGSNTVITRYYFRNTNTTAGVRSDLNISAIGSNSGGPRNIYIGVDDGVSGIGGSTNGGAYFDNRTAGPLVFQNNGNSTLNISSAGAVLVNNLAGTGTRPVYATSTGTLTTGGGLGPQAGLTKVTYSYSASGNQSWTAPSNVSQILVKIWGAGGAGADVNNGPGGAGGALAAGGALGALGPGGALGSGGAGGPGQRHPAVYASEDNLTPVCNALAAARVTGVGLYVADWTGSREDAVAMLQASSGPYPVVAVQYADEGLYDVDVWLASWLDARSAKAAPQPAPVVKPSLPPGQWNNPQAWTWSEVSVTGTGLDGKMHTFAYSRPANVWVKVL